MSDTRYSLEVTGNGQVVRLFTINRGRFVLFVLATLALPFALSLYLVDRHTQQRMHQLTLRAAQLHVENAAFRAASGELSEKMLSLQESLSRLAMRHDIDPALRQSVSQLPDDTLAAARLVDTNGPDATSQTLDRLHLLLGSLDHTLRSVREGVAYREALTEATPTIWPAVGWISAGYGYRADPFTGERDFHPAVDISSDKGLPVYATATGRVISASRNGAFGNLVEIDHGFGLVTRYGHLSAFAVEVGDTVLRGDVIGAVGATGRATGNHVHYEILANGRSINPMALLVDADVLAAN